MSKPYRCNGRTRRSLKVNSINMNFPHRYAAPRPCSAARSLYLLSANADFSVKAHTAYSFSSFTATVACALSIFIQFVKLYAGEQDKYNTRKESKESKESASGYFWQFQKVALLPCNLHIPWKSQRTLARECSYIHPLPTGSLPFPYDD